jgi:hypothetical protein
MIVGELWREAGNSAIRDRWERSADVGGRVGDVNSGGSSPGTHYCCATGTRGTSESGKWEKRRNLQFPRNSETDSKPVSSTLSL